MGFHFGIRCLSVKTSSRLLRLCSRLETNFWMNSSRESLPSKLITISSRIRTPLSSLSLEYLTPPRPKPFTRIRSWVWTLPRSYSIGLRPSRDKRAHTFTPWFKTTTILKVSIWMIPWWPKLWALRIWSVKFTMPKSLLHTNSSRTTAVTHWIMIYSGRLSGEINRLWLSPAFILHRQSQE